MRYKGAAQARTQELRRLWLVTIYNGDKEDPDCPLKEETVIAWNSTDAVRRCGADVALLPTSLGFVTWDEEPLFIESTKGPTDQVAHPTIKTTDDGWNF
jgi:hypothetical protein